MHMLHHCHCVPFIFLADIDVCLAATRVCSWLAAASGGWLPTGPLSFAWWGIQGVQVAGSGHISA